MEHLIAAPVDWIFLRLSLAVAAVAAGVPQSLEAAAPLCLGPAY